ENAELSQNGFAAVISEPGASLSITNSTISKNGGPGVDVQGSATLLNDTIASNKGGGIFNESGSTVSATNLIVAGNGSGKPANDPTSTHDCHAPLNTVVTSLDQDGTCGVGITADPTLAPLNLYGGSTATQPPRAGSPAIDAGSNTPCPAVDQRGVARPRTASNPCDLGAHEGSWILTALPISITAGQSAHDTAQLLSVGPTSGGTVTYALYTNNTCTSLAATQPSPATVTVMNGTVPNSADVMFNSPGLFFWNAVYSGDTNNLAATSPCETLTVQKVSGS